MTLSAHLQRARTEPALAIFSTYEAPFQINLPKNQSKSKSESKSESKGSHENSPALICIPKPGAS